MSPPRRSISAFPLSTLKYKMDKLEVRQLARRIRGV